MPDASPDAACALGASPLPQVWPAPGTSGLRLCHADDLRDGQARGFDPHGSGQDALFLLRHAGQLHAWRNACPHVPGAPMAWKRDAYLSADATRVVCAAHGARFLPDTGECVHGPCLGQRLARVAIWQDAHGQVFCHAASLANPGSLSCLENPNNTDFSCTTHEALGDTP